MKVEKLLLNDPLTIGYLYQHFCTFGMFHTVASDPARVFIGDAVKQLMKWFSARHKVSLTARHELLISSLASD